MDGIFLLDKARGMTSFQSLGQVKKNLGIKKVGHTGTLDKFAHGLMVIVSGRFTKLAPFFSGLDKVYEAEICFGKETTTLDPEGEIVAEADIPDFAIIKSELENFKGSIKQRPPRFSAIHIDGKRAYQRTLNGEEGKEDNYLLSGDHFLSGTGSLLAHTLLKGNLYQIIGS